jgi:hypothetical protein
VKPSASFLKDLNPESINSQDLLIAKENPDPRGLSTYQREI